MFVFLDLKKSITFCELVTFVVISIQFLSVLYLSPDDINVASIILLFLCKYSTQKCNLIPFLLIYFSSIIHAKNANVDTA